VYIHSRYVSPVKQRPKHLLLQPSLLKAVDFLLSSMSEEAKPTMRTNTSMAFIYVQTQKKGQLRFSLFSKLLSIFGVKMALFFNFSQKNIYKFIILVPFHRQFQFRYLDSTFAILKCTYLGGFVWPMYVCSLHSSKPLHIPM
jgi:hypothetical protein